MDVIFNGVLHIRIPQKQDVLSGRGGGINNHPGNKAYREIVDTLKPEYNLGRKPKDQKNGVAQEVVRQIKNLPIPGRFLKKANKINGDWWVETDKNDVLKKVTQALREGAKAYKEAEQNSQGDPQSSPKTTKKRKKKASSAAAKKAARSLASESKQAKTGVTISEDTSSMDDETETRVLSLPLGYQPEQYLLPSNDNSTTQQRNLQELKENVEKAIKDGTPPLASVDEPLHNLPPLSLGESQSPHVRLRRNNSLYLGNDSANDISLPFCDPFQNEDHLYYPQMAVSANNSSGQMSISPTGERYILCNNGDANAKPATLTDHEICPVHDQLSFPDPVADQANLLYNLNANANNENNEPSAALSRHEICSVPDQFSENDDESMGCEGCGNPR